MEVYLLSLKQLEVDHCQRSVLQVQMVAVELVEVPG